MKKNKRTKIQPPPVKTSQNLYQPSMFTTNHHKQPPSLKNEEENVIFFTIFRKVLLKLKTLNPKS